MIIIEIILIISLVLYTTWLWKNWLILKHSLLQIQPAEDNSFQPSISVIIPARNEAVSITKCLQGIVDQDYSNYEIIVVDDHSTDATRQIAQEIAFCSKHVSFQVLSLSEAEIGKKKALQAGIQAAQGEWIVTTDADCWHQPEWLSTLTLYMQPNVAVVAGPVRIEAGKHFFEQAQALESAALVALGGTLIENQTPIFANGANFAFKKTAFQQVDGYSGIDQIASGDDELLLHRFHKAGFPIRFCWNSQAAVSTLPEKSISQWWQQRRRWVSKSFYYQRVDISLAQITAWITHIGILGFLFYGIFYPKIFPLVFLAWIIILIPDYLIVRLATRFLKNSNLLKIWLLSKLIYLLYVSIIGIWGNLGKKYHWKDRLVK